MAQPVKDLTWSLLHLWSLLWLRYNTCSGNQELSHAMAQPKKNKMKKFVFIAAVLGFTNVFVAMTQQKNSPIPLHNNGIETFTVYEADGSNYCYNGGRGATSCSISGGIDIKGGGASAACDVSCQTGYYACCGIRCTCEKY